MSSCFERLAFSVFISPLSSCLQWGLEKAEICATGDWMFEDANAPIPSSTSYLDASPGFAKVTKAWPLGLLFCLDVSVGALASAIGGGDTAGLPFSIGGRGTAALMLSVGMDETAGSVSTIEEGVTKDFVSSTGGIDITGLMMSAGAKGCAFADVFSTSSRCEARVDDSTTSGAGFGGEIDGDLGLTSSFDISAGFGSVTVSDVKRLDGR
jgi:hypothetical protein